MTRCPEDPAFPERPHGGFDRSAPDETGVRGPACRRIGRLVGLRRRPGAHGGRDTVLGRAPPSALTQPRPGEVSRLPSARGPRAEPGPATAQPACPAAGTHAHRGPAPIRHQAPARSRRFFRFSSHGGGPQPRSPGDPASGPLPPGRVRTAAAKPPRPPAYDRVVDDRRRRCRHPAPFGRTSVKSHQYTTATQHTPRQSPPVTVPLMETEI